MLIYFFDHLQMIRERQMATEDGLSVSSNHHHGKTTPGSEMNYYRSNNLKSAKRSAAERIGTMAVKK